MPGGDFFVSIWECYFSMSCQNLTGVCVGSFAPTNGRPDSFDHPGDGESTVSGEFSPIGFG